MKKSGIINTDISKVLSELRHTDTICIGDIGLPYPDNVRVIDLSLKIGSPSFIEVLEEVLKDMKVEHFFLASEIRDKNIEINNKVLSLLSGISHDYISHIDFKNQTAKCKVIIRTGEATPYANVILQSACIF